MIALKPLSDCFEDDSIIYLSQDAGFKGFAIAGKNQEEIGELPLSWNYLVGEYPKPTVKPHAIHYTNGGPWFDGCQNVDFSTEWLQECEMLNKAKSQ